MIRFDPDEFYEAEIDRILSEKDELGVVTELRAQRKRWKSIIDVRLRRFLHTDEFKDTVRDTVRDAVRQQTLAISQPSIDRLRVELGDRVKENVSVRQVVQVVSDVTGIPVALIAGPARKREICDARFLACHMLRVIFGLSTPQIGLILGGRDHTSIMHAFRQIDARAGDEPFAAWFADERIKALRNGVTSDTAPAGGEVDGRTERSSHPSSANIKAAA